MNSLLGSRGSGKVRPAPSRLDASLYEAFISKFAAFELNDMVGELRTWTEAVPASRATAAMARLLDLAVLNEELMASDRRRAAMLAIVVEQIVRSKLGDHAAAIRTIEGAYRLLLHFGEIRMPWLGVGDWIRRERKRRGMPPLDTLSPVAAPVTR